MFSTLYSSTSWMDSYIQNLLIPVQQTKLGIGWDDTIFTVSLLNLKKTRNYHIQFSIPYAKQSLKWELYFNPLYPELGPDLVFDEEEYLHCDNVNNFASNLPSLMKWNPNDNKSLFIVLLEILEIYKQYQIKLLHLSTDRLADQYIKLVKKFPLEDVEIIVVRGSKQIESKFLIKLQFEVPQTLFNKSENTGVLLFTSIFGSTWNRVTPELYLPSHLENLLNGSESLHIPPLHDSQYLYNYVVELKESIIEKIFAISQYIQKRKHFISVLLVLYSSNIIEYDITAYRRVSLLLEYIDFYFILSFTIPINFPNEQFRMKLQSVYHMTDQGKPIHKNIDNFPYNSIWEPKHMVIKALTYIFEKEIINFQNTLAHPNF